VRNFAYWAPPTRLDQKLYSADLSKKKRRAATFRVDLLEHVAKLVSESARSAQIGGEHPRRLKNWRCDQLQLAQRLIDSRGRGHVMGLFSTRLYAAGL